MEMVEAGDFHAPAVSPQAMTRQLAELVDQTRQMLDRATSVNEVIVVVRRAGAAANVVKDALKSCSQLGRQQFVLRQEAAEVHIRTQRRAGELLLAMAKHPGGRPRGTDSRVAEVSSLPFTLNELGISARESHRWQRVARIPGDRFEEHIATCRTKHRELTTAGVMALAADVGGRRAGGAGDERPAIPPPPAGVRSAKRRLWSLVWIDPVHLASALEPARRERELERLRELDSWLSAYEASLRT